MGGGLRHSFANVALANMALANVAWKLWATIVALALLSAGCADTGQTDSSIEVEDVENAEDDQGIDQSDAIEDEVAGDEDQAEEEPEPVEASESPSFSRPFELAALPAGIATLPSLGGVQFELTSPSRVIVDDNCFGVFDPASAEPGSRETHVTVGRFESTRLDSTFTPFESVDQWVDVVERKLGEPPEATGETMELFGETLTGYRFEDVPFFGNEGTPDLMNCGSVESPAVLETFPSGFEDWFVGEMDGAVLAVISGAPTRAAAEANDEWRNKIIDTLEQVDPPDSISRLRDNPVSELAPLVIEPPDLGDRARTFTYSALGGVRFEADAAHSVYSFGDGVFIDPIGIGSNFDTDAVALALLTQFPDGTPVRSIDDVTGAIEANFDIAIQPNGQFVELFGRQLAGFSLELLENPPFAQTIPDRSASALDTVRMGALPFMRLAPQRAEVFLAETPAGVLYVSYEVNPFASEPVTLDAFATLLETAELTGPGLDAPLPPASTFGGTGTPPEPAPIIDGGPPPLFSSFGSIADGRHQLHNFGIPISADLSGLSVQPNQPGTVVFTGPGFSRGPGARGVVLIAGLQPQISPQAGGPTKVGEPVDLSDIEAFLDNPPANLDISNVSETQVAGLDAYRFDVQVSADATCAQDDPCEYAFEAAWDWPFALAITATNEHRIWWIAGHPAGPAMIHIADNNPDFLEIGTSLVDSIQSLE